MYGAIKFARLVAGNIIVFILLFALLEMSYRIRQDGIPGAFINIANYFLTVPYSNLGTDNWIVYDEVLGYRLNPNNPGVNSLSMRDREVATPKPRGVYRIIYLGDSIPWDRPGFVSFTGEALSREDNIEVYNAGVPGYTTYQELMFLKNYLLVSSPDMVILTYCLNDNYKFLHRFDAQARMLVTAEAAEAFRVNSPVDAITSHSYILTRIRLGLLAMTSQRTESTYPWDNRADFYAAWKDDSWPMQEIYIVEMKDILERIGSKFAIVVFPIESQLNQEYLRTNYNYVVKPQSKLREICGRYDIPCLDLFPAFRADQNQGARLFRDGIHLTADGHRLVAEQILEFLHGPANLLPAK